MSVALMAETSAKGVVLERLPALVGEAAGSKAAVDDAIEGNYHCLISRVDGQLVVWDLGGNGGTFVNGTRVTHAALKEGDTLRLAGADFKVHDKDRPRRYLFGVRN